VILLVVTLAGGAVVTFAPQMVSSPGLTTIGLLVMGAVAALGRWRAGFLADRHGAEPFIWPLLLLTAAGMALTAWSVADPGDTGAVRFLVAMAVVGVCYGALQNLTLLVAFNAVSRAHHNLASAVWNVGFDAGTAIGSVAVGAMAVSTSFSTGLYVTAALAAAALPIALARPRRTGPGPSGGGGRQHP
jgi:predicted MFS family arabinose efflux permease